MDEEIYWFDHLEMDKVCTDTPDLKLVVTTSTETPTTGLVHGTQNPLTAMGVSTMNIELKGLIWFFLV